MSAGGPAAPHGPPLDETLRARMVRAITSAIRGDAAVWGHLRELLAAAGKRMPVSVALEHLAATLERAADAVLVEVTQDDEEHLAEIRRFFLEPRATYSAGELAALWRTHPDTVGEVYYDRVMESSSSPEDLRIEWHDVAHATVADNLLRPFDVERALGDRFALARDDRWKTIPVLIRIPRFVAARFAPDPSMPPQLTLARRIEQVILEFTMDHLVTDEVSRQ
jgi:hypothetical protein